MTVIRIMGTVYKSVCLQCNAAQCDSDKPYVNQLTENFHFNSSQFTLF